MHKATEKEILNLTVTETVVGTSAVAKKTPVKRFITLHAHEGGERIPLTIADYGREKGTIMIIFQIVGKTAMLLNQLNIGDGVLDLVGSLDKPSHVGEYKKVCVIGEGVDCVITYPTARTLHENGTEVTAITGFRNEDLITLGEKFKQVSTHTYLVSDDGSTDVEGLVINVLEDLVNKGESFDETIAIGPLTMMKFVCQLTEKYGIKTVVSMNPIVTDGTGMCSGCRLSVGGETKSAYVDGPDFDGHLVDLDETMPRGTVYRDFEAHTRDATCNLIRFLYTSPSPRDPDESAS